MRKQTKTGASNTGSKPKTFLIADDNQNVLDIFNSSQNANKPQTIYGNCTPSTSKHLGAVKLNGECSKGPANVRIKLFEYSKIVCRKYSVHYPESDSAIIESSKSISHEIREKIAGEVK